MVPAGATYSPGVQTVNSLPVAVGPPHDAELATQPLAASAYVALTPEQFDDEG